MFRSQIEEISETTKIKNRPRRWNTEGGCKTKDDNVVYYFKFEIEPAKNNRYYCRIGYGEASIFVSDKNGFGDDLDTMIDIARAYIIAQTWVPLTLVDARETNPPAPDWNKEQVELYQTAVQRGISGFFVASPKEDVPGGPTMLLRPY